MSWRELFVKAIDRIINIPIKWSDKRVLLGDIVQLVAAEVNRTRTTPYIRVKVNTSPSNVIMESLWLGDVLLIWDVNDPKICTTTVYDESSDHMDFAEREISQFILDVYGVDVDDEEYRDRVEWHYPE